MRKLFLILLIISLQAHSVNYFNPFEKISNASFEIRSTQLEEFLRTKFLNLNKDSKPYLSVFFAKPNRIGVKLNGVGRLKPKIVDKIEKYFQKKLSVMIMSNFKDFIKDYKKVPIAGDNLRLIDENGILDYQEITITKDTNEEFNFILKKPLGTHMVNYKFIGKNKVLKKVEKKEYEGIGSIIMDFDFHYKTVSSYYVPSKIEASFVQTMRGAEVGYQVTRDLKESLEFSNYKINDNSALKWLSRQR